MSAALAAGAEIGIFAEGTLHRMPGLLPFQLGAFRAAVEADTRVVPVVLRGTRSVHCATSPGLRAAPLIRVHMGWRAHRPRFDRSCAARRGSGPYACAMSTRTVMLRHCGEPDLAGSQALLDLAERSAAVRSPGLTRISLRDLQCEGVETPW